MAANLHEGSAKIYQFPKGGRAAFGGVRQDTFAPSAEVAPVPVPVAVSGGGWYHEAAIQQAQRAVKR